MQLSASQKTAILSGLLQQRGLTASYMNGLLKQEKGGTKAAKEAKATLDGFVKDFDRMCVVAERLKLAQRNDKPLTSVRRSLERLSAQRPPLERFKHYAKSEGRFDYVKALVKDRTQLSATEAIVVFSNSNKSSGEAMTMQEAIRHSVISIPGMAAAAKKFCVSLGFRTV